LTTEEAHRKFVDRVGMYNGFLFQTVTHFKDILREQKRYSEQINQPDFVRPIMGNKLLYRNPITVKYEFAYHHSVDEKNLEETLENLKSHYFNFVVAQCFEAFETFLKDIVSVCLTLNSTGIMVDKPINTSSFETCRKDISSYCRSKNKYNKKLFDLMYQINPKVSESESKNFLRFDFKQWNVVFTEIRHCIVHANSQFKLATATNWTDFQNELLNQLFVAKSENGVGQISTVADYDYIIKIIAQHGQIINDCLTNEKKNGS
jgi:hypothetical protein